VLEVVLGSTSRLRSSAVLLAFTRSGFFQERARSGDSRRLKSRPRAERVGPAAICLGDRCPLPDSCGHIVKACRSARVAADVRLTEGSVLLDQSMLTGESVPIEGWRRVEDLRRSAGAAR